MSLYQKSVVHIILIGQIPKAFQKIKTRQKWPLLPIVTQHFFEIQRFKQSVVREENEGLMLKLQYFDHLMQRSNSLEMTLMLGKIEGKRRMAWQRMQ